MNKLQQYQKALLAVDRACNKAESLRTELAEFCTHPPEFVKPYPWEHDNGYGRQKMMMGQICRICRKIDAWKRGVFLGSNGL